MLTKKAYWCETPRHLGFGGNGFPLAVIGDSLFDVVIF